MKKLAFLMLALVIYLSGCKYPKTDEILFRKDYNFLSTSWGDSLETVQKSESFKGVKIEIIKDDEIMTNVLAKGIDFHGYTVDVLLLFGNKDYANKGLSNASIQYDDSDEEKILATMTEIYGNTRDYYQDKNGFQNPITPYGWFTEETVEASLSDAAKEKYMGTAKDTQAFRIDTLLGKPLVIISFDEEKNQIIFNGFNSSVVREFNNKTK